MFDFQLHTYIIDFLRQDINDICRWYMYFSGHLPLCLCAFLVCVFEIELIYISFIYSSSIFWRNQNCHVDVKNQYPPDVVSNRVGPDNRISQNEN